VNGAPDPLGLYRSRSILLLIAKREADWIDNARAASPAGDQRPILVLEAQQAPTVIRRTVRLRARVLDDRPANSACT
jgi:hypothetical protein